VNRSVGTVERQEHGKNPPTLATIYELDMSDDVLHMLRQFFEDHRSHGDILCPAL
jgi:hypothetical protein